MLSSPKKDLIVHEQIRSALVKHLLGSATEVYEVNV